MRQIETFLERVPQHFQDTVFELRNIISSVAPDAVEAVRWGGLSYFHEGSGGIVSAGICQIGIHEDHVRLAFIHGAFLPDPRHLLEGKEKYKRFIKIYSYDDAPWDYLNELITTSSHFDPYSLQMQK